MCETSQNDVNNRFMSSASARQKARKTWAMATLDLAGRAMYKSRLLLYLLLPHTLLPF